MDVLQEHLGKMENLGHSPSRYVPEKKGLLNYLKSEFSRLTGYRHNQFRDVTESDTIEHVPKKGSIYPKDVIEEIVAKGMKNLGYGYLHDLNYAENLCKLALFENKKFEAGCDEEINILANEIVNARIGYLLDDFKSGNVVNAELRTFPSLKCTTRELGLELAEKLHNIEIEIVDKYIEVAQSFLGESVIDWNNYLKYGEQFSKKSGVDFNERLVHAGLRDEQPVS